MNCKIQISLPSSVFPNLKEALDDQRAVVLTGRHPPASPSRRRASPLSSIVLALHIYGVVIIRPPTSRTFLKKRSISISLIPRHQLNSHFPHLSRYHPKFSVPINFFVSNYFLKHHPAGCRNRKSFVEKVIPASTRSRSVRTYAAFTLTIWLFDTPFLRVYNN